MSRRRRLIAIGAASVVAVAGIGSGTANAAQAGHKPGKDKRVLKILNKMTLEEKVAQLFVLQVYGTSADTTDPTAVAANQKLWGVDNAQQLIAKYHPGGIIYYYVDPPNLVSPQQVAHLSNGIQQAAMHTRVPIPETITTDQEQGSIVTRVPAPFTQFPGAQALGAARSPKNAFTTSKITGEELKAIGITQDYAPDSDVNVNPANPVIGVRSPGSDPSLVAQIASAEVDGYQAAGVIATAKHFPGHGDTNTDSHTGVPIINHTKEQWEKLDLPPFKADIAHGVDSIMTAHIIVPALDPSGDPATLSKPILTGILRDQLHYKGVVVTDALGMAGLRAKYGDDRIPVLAVKAGVDQLEKPPADAGGKGLYTLQRDSLVNAVKSGEISEARIDQSVYRILEQKLSHGLFQHPYVDESKVAKVVGTPSHLATEQKITDQTTTLVKNAVLPLPKDNRKVFVTGYGVTTTQTLANDIGKRGPVTSVLQTGTSPTPATIDKAVAQAKDNDLTVVTTNAAWNLAVNGPGQMNLVKALVATGKPVVVASVRDAYDIGYFPEAPTYLVTYGYTPASLESLTKVLFGEISPQGKLPVMIPVADHPDQTLYPYGYGLTFNK
ncbi:glycoside hydrolase family 3 protein [Actinoallomurus iriomotensis]|uniref:glycoside hydrolase family 3 protein n=1 Tax=Actinoallomurus iriomotensis TaxID=478107 RepID=UPI002552F9C7|nr:glycoside hydrolase family 3 protein [Actinoallomurus iriomotensis]